MMNFEVYNMKELQHFLQLLNEFEINGTPIPIARQRISDVIYNRTNRLNAERRSTVKERIAFVKEKVFKKDNLLCIKCNKPAVLFEVNNSPSTMIGEGYKTAILCNNSECRYTEYSKKSINEYLGRSL